MSAEANNNNINIKIRPVDDGWIMGDDWAIDVPNTMSIRELMQYIEFYRNISEHRQIIRLPNGKVVLVKHEYWALRQHAIEEGSVVQVEPTRVGGWIWESREYYINKLTNDINTIIRAHHGRILLTDLEAKISCPPCLQMSMLKFLRIYPDRFYIHTDTNTLKKWIHEQNPTGKPFLLPTFSTSPLTLSTYDYNKAQEYKQVYDEAVKDPEIKKIMNVFDPSSIPPPSYTPKQYELVLLEAEDIKRIDDFDLSNPVAIIFLNDEEIGQSSVKRNTINPHWKDPKYEFSVDMRKPLEESVLKIELYNYDEDEQDIKESLGTDAVSYVRPFYGMIFMVL
jgi:hypothetical protein